MNGRPVVTGDYDPFDQAGVVERAGGGERAALHQLCEATRAFVARMCRAELGVTLGVDGADHVAAQLVPVVIAGILDDRSISPLRVAYTETVLGIESARPSAGPAAARDRFRGLTRHARDVLVLRVVVGLTVEQAAAALACTASRILLDQHEALATLRERSVPGSSIHS